MAVDLTFVLDVSVSIGGDEHFDNIKAFVKSISQFINIGMNESLVGVVLYAHDAWIKFDLQQYLVKSDLIEAIDRIVYSNISKLNHTGTNTPAALQLLGTAGEIGGPLRLRHEPNKLKIAVFVTDGRTNTKDQTNNTRSQDRYETKVAAKKLHKLKIYDHIYTVGIRGNREVDFEELNYIATDESQVFIIDDFSIELLMGVRRTLIDLVCNRKLTM